MSFSLLAAGMLVFAAAAAIPIAIHLLAGRKADPVPIGTLRLLLAGEPREVRSFARIRDIPLLALRVAAVLLLALTAARPLVAGPLLAHRGDRDGAVAIILDDTFGMRAASGGIRRFDRARTAAEEILRDLAPGARAAVLRATRPGGRLSLDVESERARLAEAEPTYRHATLGPALRAASLSLRESPCRRREIYLVTDLQAASMADITPEDVARITLDGIDLVIVDVGEEVPNRRITGARVEAPATPGGEAWISFDVAGASGETVADLTVDGAVRARAVLTPRPDGTAHGRVVLPVLPREGPVVVCEIVLRGRDALVEDDVRTVAVPIVRPVRVVVVAPAGDGSGAAALRLALDPLGTGDRYLPQAAAQVPQSAGAGEVLVLAGATLDTAGLDRLREAVGRGAGLLVIPPVDPALVATDLLPWTVRGAVQPRQPLAVRTPLRGEGPPFLAPLAEGRNGNLGRVACLRYADVGGEAALSFENGAPFLLLGVGAPPAGGPPARGGRVALLATAPDRAWSNLAASPAFAVLTDLLVAWLAGGADEERPEATVGDAVPLEGAGVTTWEIVGPPGAAEAGETSVPRSIEAPAGGGSAFRPDRPGAYVIHGLAAGRGTESRTVVAVLPAEESDMRRRDVADLVRMGAVSRTSVQEAFLALPPTAGRSELLGLAACVLLGLLAFEARRARR